MEFSIYFFIMIFLMFRSMLQIFLKYKILYIERKMLLRFLILDLLKFSFKTDKNISYFIFYQLQ